MLDGVQINPFLLLSGDDGSLRDGVGGGSPCGVHTSLIDRSGETLTRLTAAQSLCSMEQIESIVFLFLRSLSNWRALRGGMLAGSGSCLIRYKIKGMCQKAPTQDLKESPNRCACRLKAVAGWWMCEGREVMVFIRHVLSEVLGVRPGSQDAQD